MFFVGGDDALDKRMADDIAFCEFDDGDAFDDTLRPNATCADCGVDYSKAEHDRSVWCDPCSDRRDRWATAMEIRIMAKAFLSADLSTVKDVA